MIARMGVAPPTQDATLPADKIGIGGRRKSFFFTFFQGINEN
jgi:hypothetical protein